jgi:site-specific recombinase XerD
MYDPVSTFPIMNRWADFMRARGLSERTIREQTQTVGRIATECGVPPWELTSNHLVGWFARKRLAPGSRATYRTALRAYFDWLILTDQRADDPTRKLGRQRLPRYQPRPILTEHLPVLLRSSIHARTRTMILLGAYQGFRVSEIANIRGEHVDRVAKQLSVVGKGGYSAVLPLSPVIELECRRYPTRGWWFPSHTRPGPIQAKSVSTIVSHAMRRANVPGTAHSLRHWFASELLERGVDVRVVQELMRHRSLATTAIYTRVSPRMQREAIARLPQVA